MIAMAPLWVLVFAIGVDAVDNPRPRGGWVSDQAEVLAADAEARMEALLARIHVDTGAEVAVVTVDAVDSSPKEFATALFNRWGVGSRERDDGVLFVMVMGERRLEVEVGYGLEDRLPDGWLGTMQAAEMVPRFKQGDFAGGLEVGVAQVGARLGASGMPAAAEVPGVAALVDAPSHDFEAERLRWVEQGLEHEDASRRRGSPLPDWLLFGIYGAGCLGIGGGLVRGGRILHHKRCRPCKAWRKVLDEVADDAHLNEGQRTEEELGSVDYDVFVCGGCSSVSVMGKRAWFSGYQRCGACTYRTLNVESVTEVAATTSSEGLARITENCMHCRHHCVYTRTIPRIQTQSSSGGSSFGGGGSSFGGGGGSFGGGSSGGGGAGSSW